MDPDGSDPDTSKVRRAKGQPEIDAGAFPVFTVGPVTAHLGNRGNTMTKFFADFLRDESGASAAEYVILVGVLGALVAGGTFLFGTSLKTALTDQGAAIENCAANASATGC